MSKFFATIIIVSMILCIGFSSPAISDTEKQTLTYIVKQEPEVLDPGLAAEYSVMAIFPNIFEGLTRIDNHGLIQPGVGERTEVSEDGLTYTFHLNKNAKWCDGKPLTSHDFVYAWERVINPATGADYAWVMLPYIKNAQKYYDGKVGFEEVGISAKDDYTLEVTLEEPTPFFTELTAFWTYAPVRKDIVESGADWHRKAETLICNGAFKVSEIKFGQCLTLVRNENYHNKERVHLDRIKYEFVEDANTALSAFEAGKADGISFLPDSEIPRLKMTSDAFRSLPKVETQFIDINVKEKPFDDVRVRKALNLAINKKEIVDNVLRGGQIPATALVPPGITFGGEDFRNVGGDFGISPTGNIEKAKKLLAEAGYPDGKGFPTIRIKTNGDKEYEVIAKMWEDNLGIKSELVTREWKIHIKELKALDFKVARGGWTGDYNHPSTFLDIFTPNSGTNYTNWLDEEYVRIIRAAHKETDTKKQLDLYHQAEKILIDASPIIPLYYNRFSILMNPEVKDWFQSPLGTIIFSSAYKVK